MDCKAERIGAIDIARGMAIMLVILGHMLYQGRLRSFIYEFHMPLFFFLSGMVLRSPVHGMTPAQAKENLRAILRKRARSYLIPYAIWGCLFMPVKPSGLALLVYASRQSIAKGGTLVTLWFLPVLFLASVWSEMLLFAVRDRSRPRLLAGGGALLLFAAGFLLPHPLPLGYPFGFDISLLAAGFMLLAYCLRPLLHKLRDPRIAGLGGALCALLLAVLSWWYPNGINMSMESYGDIRSFLLYSMLGTLAVLGAAAVLDRIPYLNRALRYAGRNTMVIYILHLWVNTDLDRIMAALTGPLKTKIAVIAIQSLIDAGICLAIGVLLERWFPVALGKKGQPAMTAARSS